MHMFTGDGLQAELSRRQLLRGAVVAGAGVSLLGLAACGDEKSSGTGTGAATTGGSVPYDGVFAAPNYTALVMTLPLYVAEVNGYFREEDLSFEVQSFATGVDAVRAVATNAKIGTAAVFAAVTGFSAGLSRLRMVGTTLQPNTLVYVVKPDSDIADPSDLRGKKIGTQSATSNVSYAAQVMLEGAGVSKDDVEFVDTKSIPDTLTALENGVIDCGFSAPPFSAQLENDGRVRVLWAWGLSDAPPMTEAGVFVDAGFLAENRDVVRRFLTATARGQQFIQQNLDEAAEIYSRGYRVELATARQVLEQYSPGYLLPVEREGVELNIEAADSVGVLESEVAFEDFADADIAQEALEAV